MGRRKKNKNKGVIDDGQGDIPNEDGLKKKIQELVQKLVKTDDTQTSQQKLTSKRKAPPDASMGEHKSSRAQAKNDVVQSVVKTDTVNSVIPNHSSKLAGFKIPKRKPPTETTTVPKAETSYTSDQLPLHIKENQQQSKMDASKRTHENDHGASDNAKRVCDQQISHNAEKKGITKDNANLGDQSNTTHDSRTILKAKRSAKPSNNTSTSSPKTDSKDVIETPQMKQLREAMAKREREKNRNKTVTVTPQMKQLKEAIARLESETLINKATFTGAQRQQEKLVASPPIATMPPTLFESEPKWKPSTLQNPMLATASLSDATSVPEPTMQTPENDHVPKDVLLSKLMDDSSYEETVFDDMDVDISLPSKPSKRLNVIFDTNVWIDHRNVIGDILKIEIPSPLGPVRAMIILPWMVLQEIDYNIHKGNKVFRDASKYLNSLLSAKDRRVKGQQAAEAIIGTEFNELMADDSILNCAIKYSQLSHCVTVFVTNDINLMNKALVHNLNAFKADNNLPETIRKLYTEKTYVDGGSNRVENGVPDIDATTTNDSLPSVNLFGLPSFSCTPTPTPITNTNTLYHVSSINVPYNVESEDVLMDVDDPDPMMGVEDTTTTNNSVTNTESMMESPSFEAVVKYIQQVLTGIIIPKMIEEFGRDGWKFAIKIQPPYTVESGLKCLQAHWIAVFSFVFSTGSKDALDELLNIFQKKPTGMEELRQWRLSLCQISFVLLSKCNKVSREIRSRVSECCRLLQGYIQLEAGNVLPNESMT